jgi:recombination protein RecA
MRLGQGKENTRVFLTENPDIAAEVEAKVRAALGAAAEPGARREARAAGGVEFETVEE